MAKCADKAAYKGCVGDNLTLAVLLAEPSVPLDAAPSEEHVDRGLWLLSEPLAVVVASERGGSQSKEGTS